MGGGRPRTRASSSSLAVKRRSFDVSPTEQNVGRNDSTGISRESGSSAESAAAASAASDGVASGDDVPSTLADESAETNAAERKGQWNNESCDAEINQSPVAKTDGRKNGNAIDLSFVADDPSESGKKRTSKKISSSIRRKSQKSSRNGEGDAATEATPREVTLSVTCGSNVARLFLNLLESGSRGRCVHLSDGTWMTPNEFQAVSGRGNAKDWKRSIRHHDRSLKLLEKMGLLSLFSPPVCLCEFCDQQVSKSIISSRYSSTIHDDSSRILFIRADKMFPSPQRKLIILGDAERWEKPIFGRFNRWKRQKRFAHSEVFWIWQRLAMRTRVGIVGMAT
jgi:hypothetical protein